MLINLWSGPRNVSTALMYAFRERPDTTVVDEPLYAAWLARHPDADHPGRADTLASQPSDPTTVVDLLLADDWPTPVVFAKQMAAHLDGIDRQWLDRCGNAILVRPPEEVIASYSEVVALPTATGLGYSIQLELLRSGLDHDRPPVVLETSRVLEDPRGVLTRACGLLGLEFDEAMLSWPPGPSPEDGVWAPHWYGATHSSTGFGTPRDHDPARLSPALTAVAATCRPAYEELAAHAL